MDDVPNYLFNIILFSYYLIAHSYTTEDSPIQVNSSQCYFQPFEYPTQADEKWNISLGHSFISIEKLRNWVKKHL